MGIDLKLLKKVSYEVSHEERHHWGWEIVSPNEVLSETWAKLAEIDVDWSEIQEPQAYIRTVARHQAMNLAQKLGDFDRIKSNQLRQARTKDPTETAMLARTNPTYWNESEDRLPTSPSAEEVAERRQQIRDRVARSAGFRAAFLGWLDEVLWGLSPTQERAVRAFYVDGLSSPEIGRDLGISEGGIYRHLSDARKRLDEATLNVLKLYRRGLDEVGQHSFDRGDAGNLPTDFLLLAEGFRVVLEGGKKSREIA